MNVPEASLNLSQLPLLGSNVPFAVDGRVHHIKFGHSHTATELVLRHDTCFITAIILSGVTDCDSIDRAATLTVESLVRVRGTIHNKDKSGVHEFISISRQILVSNIVVISAAKEGLYDATPFHNGPDKSERLVGVESACLDVRLDNRVIDARVPATAAIFKIISGIHHFAVDHLHDHDFHWVATPKLINYKMPGDDDYFEVPYVNGQQARLTQTGELHLGLALAADLERVYDIHTVFRRELAVSPRHLTEVDPFQLQ
jgi:aspartyl/asparaginyl-tRNA synthetase